MPQVIGIVGMGWVGSSVASAILHRGIASDLLLHDIRSEIAEGEAMDFEHGSLSYPTDARIRATSLEEIAATADTAVIAAGKGGKPDQSRLDLLGDNAEMAKEIGRGLRGFEGTVVVVTNPVDVLTQLVRDSSGLPSARVIGTGTLLDTARLRYELAEKLRVHPASIHAQVIGEHGDSSVCVWSGARIAGSPLRSWPGWGASEEASLEERVRRAAYEIIRRKGATNHAIGSVTAVLLTAILRDERRVLTVATVQEGVHGVEGVALSLPSVVGRHGVDMVLEPSLDDGERVGLERSAGVIREAVGRFA